MDRWIDGWMDGWIDSPEESEMLPEDGRLEEGETPPEDGLEERMIPPPEAGLEGLEEMEMEMTSEDLLEGG